MLKMLQIRIQEQESYRFKKSKLTRLDLSRRWLNRSRHESIEFYLRPNNSLNSLND